MPDSPMLSTVRDLKVRGTDANGQPFDAMVAGLTARQVQFRICANTLHTLKVTTDRINPEAVVVPSGVAEIARLQARDGYAYIRP